MGNNEYHSQRLQGARDIIDRARKFAEKAGISLDDCQWDYGRESVERDNHTLTISAGENASKEDFSDEELADFPGGSGTESTTAKLRKMIRKLTT